MIGAVHANLRSGVSTPSLPRISLSPAGATSAASMSVTENVSERLLRLPLWIGSEFAVEVVEAVHEAL